MLLVFLRFFMLWSTIRFPLWAITMTMAMPMTMAMTMTAAMTMTIAMTMTMTSGNDHDQWQ